MLVLVATTTATPSGATGRSQKVKGAYGWEYLQDNCASTSFPLPIPKDKFDRAAFLRTKYTSVRSALPPQLPKTLCKTMGRGEGVTSEWPHKQNVREIFLASKRACKTRGVYHGGKGLARTRVYLSPSVSGGFTVRDHDVWSGLQHPRPGGILVILSLPWGCGGSTPRTTTHPQLKSPHDHPPPPHATH